MKSEMQGDYYIPIHFFIYIGVFYMIKENVIIKQDTTENWNKAKNFIPKEGEIIKYIDTNNLKIGDGKTLINNLPFLN